MEVVTHSKKVADIYVKLGSKNDALINYRSALNILNKFNENDLPIEKRILKRELEASISTLGKPHPSETRATNREYQYIGSVFNKENVDRNVNENNKPYSIIGMLREANGNKSTEVNKRKEVDSDAELERGPDRVETPSPPPKPPVSMRKNPLQSPPLTWAISPLQEPQEPVKQDQPDTEPEVTRTLRYGRNFPSS